MKALRRVRQEISITTMVKDIRVLKAFMRKSTPEAELRMLTQDHELKAYSDLTDDEPEFPIFEALDNSIISDCKRDVSYLTN